MDDDKPLTPEQQKALFKEWREDEAYRKLLDRQAREGKPPESKDKGIER